MTKNIIIQDEIRISQADVDRAIKDYEKMPGNYRLSMGEFDGNKDDIIREIKKLTEIGKQILIMRHRFNQWLKKEKKKKKK